MSGSSEILLSQFAGLFFIFFKSGSEEQKGGSGSAHSRLKVLAWLDIFNLRESGGLSKRSTKCESAGLGLWVLGLGGFGHLLEIYPNDQLQLTRGHVHSL